MRTLIGSVLLIFAATASAEVYKWVDKDGNVHYGDRPKTQPAEQVTRKPGELPSAPVDPEAEKAAAARKAACEAKQKELERFKAAGAISETDGLGNTREFSEAEKQQLIARTQKQADEACAPPT